MLGVLDVERVATLLKTCYNTNNLAAGMSLHSEISRSEHHSDVYLNTLLIKLYGKCGRIEHAISVFNEMPYRNIHTWNNIIAANAKVRHLQEAQLLFDLIPERSVETWTFLVIGYAGNSQISLAKSIFSQMPEKTLIASNAMLAAFAKAGELGYAETLMKNMKEWDIFSWNTILAMYCQAKNFEKAFVIFNKAVERDIVTWTAMITAYAQRGDLRLAYDLFVRMPRHDIVVWNAMVAAYGQSGMLAEARFLFESLPEKNVASWNSMMCVYTHNGQPENAIVLFERMDVVPNRISALAAIDACSSLSDPRRARVIHREVARLREIEVENAVMNMYGRCGCVRLANMVFEKMAEQNVVSWTTMVTALAQTGHFDRAVECFYDMVVNGVSPNGISFTGIMSSCDHGGSLCQARHLFLSMIQDFGIKDIADTYVCILDLFERISGFQEKIAESEML